MGIVKKIVYQGSRVVLELMPDSHIDLSDTSVWAIQMQQQQGQVGDEDDDDFQILNKSKAFNPLFIALISRFHM